jgi:hypothetical protein
MGKFAILTFRLGTALVFLQLALLGWIAFDWAPSLNLALLVMGSFIVVQTIGSYVWVAPYLIGRDRDRTDGSVASDVPRPGEAEEPLGDLPTGEGAPAPGETPNLALQQANGYRDAAKLAITTQGFVLGLISFGNNAGSTTTTRVGGAALAFGVLTATSLYLLVAVVPPPDARRSFVASMLVSLMLYALAFGLICVVSGLWDPNQPGLGGEAKSGL